jgi:hypothetical protein
MNNILDNLFYKEKLGIGNKTTFIKNVRERHPDIKVKDIQEYLKNQEVNQINTSVNIKYEYKITAPPRTFQIDIFWWKQGDTSIPILLLVDILSRKAWAYILTKSKKEKRAAVSVKTIQEFKDEVGLIRGLEGDNEFSSAAVNFSRNRIVSISDSSSASTAPGAAAIISRLSLVFSAAQWRPDGGRGRRAGSESLQRTNRCSCRWECH